MVNMQRQKASFTSVVGELLLTVGVVLLLLVVYEAFWTNLESGRLQSQADEDLDKQWQNPRQRSTPELGDAIARMYIPSYGSDWNFAILEGVDDDTLRIGPGRYPTTQGPGEAGNFALAGHRVGKGAPFNDLGELHTCDAIVVETQREWITYRVLPLADDAVNDQTRRDAAADCFQPEQVEQIASGNYAHVQGRHITTPGDVGVLDTVPSTSNPPAADDSLEELLTLTTCHPQFSNAERMIVHAMEVETIPKDGSLPAALQEEI